ncbi:3'-5' exonuclease [Coraliomargarita sp. SDUM461003]|uniref:3'-5' exonuclease n=1 Tax=Thalassobacterium maritimum TaxID=3041265 RepID=A0ABU1ATS5_9BACT|nr:3'-5' exonuclease [Coraliomargarita sp. SDUM461003]MDQ8207468.1 3'-5' exonuclease [Coraliomargarita sp. SDUM461003]
MPTFTAIDFETAQPKRWSICQVGLVRVEAGVVTQELSLLVRPPEDMYSGFNTAVHGLTARDTMTAPGFDAIWPQIANFIEGQTVVAHNMAFDGSCLKQALEFYGLPLPLFEKQCTYKLFKKKLNYCCEEFDIPLNHHDALSDARACAALYLRSLRG